MDNYIFRPNQIIFNNQRNPYTINITNTIGEGSYAIIYDVEIVYNDNVYTNYCIKIGKINNINNEVMEYINNSPYFINVYKVIRNINRDDLKQLDIILPIRGDNLDIMIMDKVDSDLGKFCSELGNSTVSMKYMNYIATTLFHLCIDMYRNNMYYFDLKADNIGVIERNNNVVIKIIDIDSLHKINEDEFFDQVTDETSPYYDNNKDYTNIFRLQILACVFTILQILFNNETDTTCNITSKLLKMNPQLQMQNNGFDCNSFKSIFVSYVLSNNYSRDRTYTTVFNFLQQEDEARRRQLEQQRQQLQQQQEQQQLSRLKLRQLRQIEQQLQQDNSEVINKTATFISNMMEMLHQILTNNMQTTSFIKFAFPKSGASLVSIMDTTNFDVKVDQYYKILIKLIQESQRVRQN